MKRFALAAVCALLLTGCKTRERVVMVETTRTDTTYITKHQRDSIWLHDSIFVSEKQKGDTVDVLQERWHTRYVDRSTHDTIYHFLTDSVPVPYPVTEYVEKQLSKWQRLRMRGGDALFAMLGIGIVFAVLKLKAKI